jgi:hypothetical protein
MSTSGEDLYSVLSAHAGLTALVSDRIYPVEAEQFIVLPLVVFTQISTSPNATHGEGVTDATLDTVDYQIDCYAESPLIAEQILAQVRLAVEGSSLLGLMRSRRALSRAEDADAHGVTGDFLIKHRPS